MKYILFLFALLFTSCASFEVSPPIVTSDGGVLFPVKGETNTYYLGTSAAGGVIIQWTQSDKSQARMVKPRKGKVVFYINEGSGWRKVGAKEPNPEIPEDIEEDLSEKEEVE